MGGIGLMYYNARWYDPAISHFTQADSIIPGAGDPQAWNRYAYVLNNPLRYTDPSGHIPLLVIVALVGSAIFFSQVPSDQYQSNPDNHGDPIIMGIGFSLMLLPLAKEAAVTGLEEAISNANNPSDLPDSLTESQLPKTREELISESELYDKKAPTYYNDRVNPFDIYENIVDGDYGPHPNPEIPDGYMSPDGVGYRPDSEKSGYPTIDFPVGKKARFSKGLTPK